MRRPLLALLCVVLPALADWRALHRAGEQLLDQGQPEAARVQLTAALAEARGGARWVVLEALGRAEFQLGNYRKAVDHLERCVAGSAQRPAALYYNLGLAYQALGSMRRAETALAQALADSPASAPIWQALGQVLFARRAHDRAEQAWRRALALSRNAGESAVAWGDLALLYQARGQPDEAAAALERAIAMLAPGQARARMLCNLGTLEWKRGRRMEAGARLEMALAEMERAVGQRHPDVGRVLEQYSLFFRSTGRGADARRMDERAREIRSAFRGRGNSRQDTVDWRDLK